MQKSEPRLLCPGSSTDPSILPKVGLQFEEWLLCLGRLFRMLFLIRPGASNSYGIAIGTTLDGALEAPERSTVST
jgi:hypothetical protein